MLVAGYIIQIFALCLVYIAYNASPVFLIDFSAGIIVFIPVVTMLLVSGMLRYLVKGFIITCFNYKNDQKNQTKIISAYNMAITGFLVMGITGMFLGVAIFLINFHDLTAVGPGAALALISPVYGLFIAYHIVLPSKINFTQKETPVVDLKSISIKPLFLFVVYISLLFNALYFTLFTTHVLDIMNFKTVSIVSLILLILGNIISTGKIKHICKFILSIIVKKSFDHNLDLKYNRLILKYLMVIPVSAGIIVFFNDIISMLIHISNADQIYGYIGNALFTIIIAVLVSFSIILPLKYKLDSSISSNNEID